MSKVKVFTGMLVTAASLLLLCSCSSLNGTRLEPLMGANVDLISLGETIAKELSQQAVPPLFVQQSDQPVLVTTLVNNAKLDETSDFGRNLQNTITNGFARLGYSTREVKLKNKVLVAAGQGEFMLSRDLNQVAKKQSAQAVVVGTYSLANRLMYLSVRLVNPLDRTIRAAYDDRLYLDENTLKMLGLQFAHQNTEVIQPPRESWIDRLFY